MNLALHKTPTAPSLENCRKQNLPNAWNTITHHLNTMDSWDILETLVSNNWGPDRLKNLLLLLRRNKGLRQYQKIDEQSLQETPEGKFLIALNTWNRLYNKQATDRGKQLYAEKGSRSLAIIHCARLPTEEQNLYLRDK